MVKRIFALLLVMTLLFSFVACGNKDVSENGNGTSAPTTQEENKAEGTEATKPTAEVTQPTATEATQGTEPATTPAESKPAETKPAETKPAETKPAETKPVETQPVETQPTTLLDAASHGEYISYQQDNEVAMLFVREFIWNGKDSASVKMIYYYEATGGRPELYYGGKRYNDANTMIDVAAKVTACTADTVSIEFDINGCINYTTFKYQDGKLTVTTSTCNKTTADPVFMANMVQAKK